MEWGAGDDDRCSPCSPASQVLGFNTCATTTGCFSFFSIWLGLAHEWAHDYHENKSVTGRRGFMRASCVKKESQGESQELPKATLARWRKVAQEASQLEGTTGI